MPLFGSPDDEQNLDDIQRRELMCEIGRRCYNAGFNDANGGNISCRLDERRVLCTPTLISKGYMAPSDLVVVDMDGNQLDGRRKKSSEVLVHLYCYKQRPDVKAVIHAHPRNANAFAITHTPIPKCVLPEIEIFVGEAPIAEYGDPGTERLPETLAPYVRDFTLLLMANHGALALGTSLIDAFWKLEIIDAYCETLIKALTLGQLHQVSDEAMGHILEVKKTLGIPDRRIGNPTLASCKIPTPTPANPPTPQNGGAAAGAPPIDEDLVRQIAQKVLERLGAE